MALTSNRLGETLNRRARSTLGLRFGRFAVAAITAFVTTEVVLTICAGPLDLSATWASLIAWFSGALVSYILSRWAWKRKGPPEPAEGAPAVLGSLRHGHRDSHAGHQVRLPLGQLAEPAGRRARALRGPGLRGGQPRHVLPEVPVLPLRPLRRITRPAR